MNWFRNRRTATKLLLAFGLVVAIVIVVAIVGNGGMSSMNASVAALYERHAIGITHMKEAGKNLVRVSRTVRSALLDDNPDAIRRRQAEVERLREAFRQSLDGFKQRAGMQVNIDKANQIRREFDALAPEQDRIIALAAAGNLKEAKAGLARIAAMAESIDTQMEQMEKGKLERMQQSFADIAVACEAARTKLLILCVAAAIAAFLIGLGLARMIGRPLVESVEVLNAVAGGDFTRKLEIDSGDEIGQMASALNLAVEGMKSALLEIRERTVEVSSAAEQLAAASEQLATGSQQQASSLEETSASLEELTATVKHNADSARQANQLAAGSRDTAEKGGRIVGSTQSAMNEINVSSRKIAEIISTVDEIAFQTNLLALNAAVEAARAGEQGRGFAVVAGEVRNLAQRSAVASREIKALIQDSVRKVETGTELVRQSGETLTEIVTSVKRVTDIVSEIAASSAEQSTGISQVGQAMSQMDKVTQANTAQTEELSATAQSLSEQAERMQQLVARFQLGGAPAASPVNRRQPRATPPPSFRTASPPSADVAGWVQPHDRDGVFQEF
jgi:methyl-accepting chemotaxis protein